MTQGRSTKIISMCKWIRTSGLLIKNSLSLRGEGYHDEAVEAAGARQRYQILHYIPDRNC